MYISSILWTLSTLLAALHDIKAKWYVTSYKLLTPSIINIQRGGNKLKHFWSSCLFF